MSKGMACDGVSTSRICDLVTKGRKKVTILTPDRIHITVLTESHDPLRRKDDPKPVFSRLPRSLRLRLHCHRSGVYIYLVLISNKTLAV